MMTTTCTVPPATESTAYLLFFSLSSFTSFTPREGLHFSFFFFIVFTASLFLFKFDVSHIIRNFAHKISHVTHRYDFDDSSLDLNLGSWILTLCTRGPQYHPGCRARDINTLVILFVTLTLKSILIHMEHATR